MWTRDFSFFTVDFTSTYTSSVTPPVDSNVSLKSKGRPLSPLWLHHMMCVGRPGSLLFLHWQRKELTSSSPHLPMTSKSVTSPGSATCNIQASFRKPCQVINSGRMVCMYWLWQVSDKLVIVPPGCCVISTEGIPCSVDLEAEWWL